MSSAWFTEQWYNKALDAILAYEKKHTDHKSPLSLFLKDFYKRFPNLGKRDRNAISDFVYGYYRVKNFTTEVNINNLVLLGGIWATDNKFIDKAFLLTRLGIECETYSTELEEESKKKFNYNPEGLTAFLPKLEAEINHTLFSQSFFKSAPVFVRMKQNARTSVLNELKSKNISYEEIKDYPNSLKFKSLQIENLNVWQEGLVEIQDLGAQGIATFLKPQPNQRWWDACAASGGKTLLLADIEPEVRILATDKRENILFNYQKRVKKSGFKYFNVQTADLSAGFDPGRMFDAIICDVPCSGSGTWHRTPEQITATLDDNLIKTQQKIALNCEPYLRSGGSLFYITCSVFETENSEQVALLTKAWGSKMKLEQQGIISNTLENSDYLFLAKWVKE